jgi:aspartyl/asparaginyl-tRNA synthetase
LATLEIKGGGQRIKMISNLSKRLRSQDMSRVSKSIPTLQLLRKERHHEEMGTYISHVSIHAYQS